METGPLMMQENGDWEDAIRRDRDWGRDQPGWERPSLPDSRPRRQRGRGACEREGFGMPENLLSDLAREMVYVLYRKGNEDGERPRALINGVVGCMYVTWDYRLTVSRRCW